MALEGKGHTVALFPFFSSVQIVLQNEDGYFGASDPRKGGEAVGHSK